MQVEVVIGQAVAHEEEGHGVEEGGEGAVEVRVGEDSAVVVLAGEDPARAVEQGTMQLEDELPTLGNVPRGARQRRPAAGEGSLKQVVDVGGEDGPQAGRERRDSPGHRRLVRELIVEVPLDDGAELAGSEAVLESRERVDILARGRQIGDLLERCGVRLASPSTLGEQLHQALPARQACGSRNSRSREND
ncbi:hypothetical protein KYC5002_07990 [Archangium violaceum]|nr:hypothetical protein KYC5002_07990 [Archangium gephyra]